MQIRTGILLTFFAVILGNVLLYAIICDGVRRINCFSYETAYHTMRDHPLSEKQTDYFWHASEGDVVRFSELLTMYFGTGGMVEDEELLSSYICEARKYKGEEFELIQKQVQSLWQDLEKFPVGKITNQAEATVSFENSWMQSRTFGGDRGHEGCDIMASVNERGLYPVVSMTDGVIEQIGWLRLGGYRIGVRSPSGAYFYYAHLSEYAKEFVPGDPVTAGMLLGFMGDTGYSEIEGTTGNFATHLHLGIYLNDDNGKEFSVNSFPMLQYLWNRQGKRLI